MKRHYKFLTSLFIISAIGIFSAHRAETKSGGSPLSNSGSIGDGASNTCAKIGCHNDFAINSFGGSISLDLSDIPAKGYAPGETYTIGVKVAENNRFTFGFQATAEDDLGNKMGTLIASNNKIRLEFTNWVTHSLSSSTGEWTFDWTAPSGNEDVTFYATGNAANGNGAPTGDHIYSTSGSVSRDLFSSIASVQFASDIKAYSVLNEKALYIVSDQSHQFVIYSAEGRMVRQFISSPGTSIENLSSLESGLYIVTEANGNFTSRFMVQ